MKARIVVTLKNGVLDPQGQAIENALSSLDFDQIKQARQGKIFDIDLDASDEHDAKTLLAGISEKLLANTVIENYDIEILNS